MLSPISRSESVLAGSERTWTKTLDKLREVSVEKIVSMCAGILSGTSLRKLRFLTSIEERTPYSNQSHHQYVYCSFFLFDSKRVSYTVIKIIICDASSRMYEYNVPKCPCACAIRIQIRNSRNKTMNSNANTHFVHSVFFFRTCVFFVVVAVLFYCYGLRRAFCVAHWLL